MENANKKPPPWRLIFMIAGIIFASGGAYHAHGQHGERITSLEQRSQEDHDMLIAVQSDVSHIREDITEQKALLNLVYQEVRRSGS